MSQRVSRGPSNKGDVAYVRATGPSPVSPTNHPHSPVSQTSSYDSPYDEREELKMRELEEARTRLQQMEKTMRWWSDCTANWREKWSKVRNERNKAREENRHIRQKLDAIAKECISLKREKQELSSENDFLKTQLVLSNSNKTNELCVDDESKHSDGDGEGASRTSDEDLKKISPVADEVEKDNSQDLVSPGHTVKCDQQTMTRSEHEDNETKAFLAEEKIIMLQLKLDESQKIIQVERDERTLMSEAVEKLEFELNEMNMKYDELKQSKEETMLQLTKVQEDHTNALGRMALELEDESSSRTTMDRRVMNLREELEKLQEENASEWGKREKIESEKLSLERENKKLKNQIEDVEEQLERKNQMTAAMIDSDLRTLQFDLTERTKDLNELRHSHAKVKKVLQEKTTELEHHKRRAEQYELEVKKLRGRVDELKKELTSAEDEVDIQTNQVRKLQRNSDEYQEQVENLQLQVDHLQTRLRRTTHPMLPTRATSLKFEPDLGDMNDLSTPPDSDNPDDED